jgi:putative ABC transport system permease protein
VVIAIIMAVMANTMAMSARERRREYATLKAVGFGPRYLLTLILGESLALSIGSGVLGIVAAFPAAGFLASKFGTLFPVFEISPHTIELGLLASCLIGLAAAVFPAWRVITLPVSEGLRSIG